MAAVKKELFINSVRQIRLDGQTIIPTAILYRDRQFVIGQEAVEQGHDYGDLREDFKVEIGGSKPARLAQIGSGRSTLGVAKDFIHEVVGRALTGIERQGFARPSRILIAEPLSLSQEKLASEDWLKNYRLSIRQILFGHFEEIDFMPEPFAVFQYYRYGIKHPLVAQKTKHVALVFDFGGGTFDASVVETTSTGDISGGGRNSRPLAAKSIPVGGFFINRVIAESLLLKTLEKGADRASLNKALGVFNDLKNAGEEDLSLQRSDLASFVRNFRRLLRSVEEAKIQVCSAVVNWRLNADLSLSPASRVEVPQRPLSDLSNWASLRLDAAEIRDIFEQRIWKQKLLPAIRETLKRASVELDGKSISIVLLSGGSSNIRWLKPLIERDLEADLKGAEILELSENFQEIVSKGLAVECARRFYTEGDGDFRATTYNRLCLCLGANGNEPEKKKMVPGGTALEGLELDPGVLLPSASSLRGLIGQPLRWKVRLSKAPSQHLDYYFMRSSFDHEDMSARHNIDSRVQTPKGAVFGRGIEVELTIREDGTAEPVFVYGRGSQGHTISVAGRPFYMDMTYAAPEAGAGTYLGFDFGTSTSSLCYVNEEDIRVYADRASDRVWLSISSLVDVLPYPAAHPLARYLSETSLEQMDKWGREAFEGMLTLSAYVGYAEHCSIEGGGGALFKGMRKRSAGPLWAMLKQCAGATGKKWSFAPQLFELTSGDLLHEIDSAVSKIAQAKHGKVVEGLDYPRLLERFGNVLVRAFSGKVFGFFEDTRRKPFSMDRFVGMFREAKGHSAPFIGVYEYEGAENFPAEFVFVVDLEKSRALPLHPFIVRGLHNGSRQSEADFYVFDIAKNDGEIGFRAVQERPEVSLVESGPYPELFALVREYLKKDLPCSVCEPLSLRTRSRAEDR